MVLRVKHAARHRELVQAHVPERVLAAGFVSTPGADSDGEAADPQTRPIDAAAEARGHVSGDGALDPSFPPQVWLAVTDTRIYAFAAGRGQVGRLVGAWDRQGTTVRKAPRLTGTRLSLSFGGSGAPTAVQTRRWTAGNHQLVTLLLDPSRTT